MSDRRRHKRGPPFLQLHHWLVRSAAWQHLSTNARCVYIAIKERYNGQNNGEIAFSARDAGDSISASHHTGNRALAELVDHGFLVITEESNFNRKMKLARNYLLTEVADDRPGRSRAPLKTFMRWTDVQQDTVSSLNATVSPERLVKTNAA